MRDETEERSLPASQKKLDDARRKGQVVHSRDLVTGFGLLVLVGYLLLAWQMLRDELSALFEVLSDVADRPFAEAWDRSFYAAFKVILLTSLPPFALAIVAVLAAGMAATRGPVFSFDPVKPKFDHINPLEGLKRIASLRNVVEFAKAIVKVLILTIAFWFVLQGSLQALFEMPSCGRSCLPAIALMTLKPLAITAAIGFFIVGLIDLILQRRLFLRDMRMTRTEFKRERKDQEGDPHIRRERRNRGAQSQRRTRVGVRHAVLAVAHGRSVVGLLYRRGETPVPMVVSKARGVAGMRMLAEARSRGIPVVNNAALVSALEQHRVGETVREALFQPVAECLVLAGVR
jgi:type III secretion protein U